ncbi:AMP-binding protein [Marinibaculum pumilum]|uniref:AMP-binding protein n=1 Tax=Marinibaculum pumilum TaxID=1766165 RepID=A0ABV7L3R9_9PROT
MDGPLKTTAPVRPVRTIADIEAIEVRPYNELVTAHSLYDLLLATAAQCGAAPALTVLRSEDPADVGTALSHRTLLAEVTRGANMFNAVFDELGVAQGRRVAAFLCPTVPELPTLLLGAQVAGIASTLNHLLNRDAVFDLLNAQAAVLLVIPAPALDRECWEKAQGALDRVPTLRRVIVIGEAPPAPGFAALASCMAGREADTLEFDLDAGRDTVCAMFHTGGTTGRPKVVRLTHGNQIHAAFGFGQVFGYGTGDTVVNGFPFFHVGGTMTVGLSVLAAGGHVLVPSPHALRRPAVIDRYWEIVRHHGATVVSGVPTSIAAITGSWPDSDPPTGVRMAVTGGALLPRAVGERFEAVTGIRLFETYGMTETAAAIAFNPGRGEPLAGSVGFRAPYSETRILCLDSEAQETCGAEESGLVQVRGPQVFPGYLDPAHDAGTLGPDGWLSTGDLGYLTAEQRLVLTGRAKDLILRGGHNIDPAAIEEVADRFDGIKASAAVGMPDQHAGEVPALFVVPADGVQVDLDALRRHLEAQIHERPALPKSILVIDALPVTAVGKVFKPALRERAIAEKVRLEGSRLCGPQARVAVQFAQDDRKRVLVAVTVGGADGPARAALAEALAPLPQIYTVAAEEA